jgi:ribosomal-protein-alanine N-acetyltransferase
LSRIHPHLIGPRVLVSLARETDAMALLSFQRRNREHLKPWSPPMPDAYYTIAYWSQWSAQARPIYDQDQGARLVMRLKDEPDGPVIGLITLSQIVRGAFQAASLGYQIDAAHEGRGLMSEALGLTVDFAFRILRLHRIMANYIPENVRSARVLERLGFRKEGYARDFLFIDGAWRDHVLTALINPEPTEPAPAESLPGRHATPARPSQRRLAPRGLKV